MQLSFSIMIAAVICYGRAEVKLKLNKNETVAFEGDELIIKVDNPQSMRDRLDLCFGSRPDVVNEYCPQGFGNIVLNIRERTETLKLNRHGNLAGIERTYPIGEDVVFNTDGSINILVIAMPYGATVSLPNAHLPVTTTTASARMKKAANNNAMLKIVFGVVLLLLLLLIIVGVLLYCCLYKKRNQQLTQVPRTHDKICEADESLPQTVAKGDVHTLPKRSASAPKTAPKLTSTSTTRASGEKPRAPMAAKLTSTLPVVSHFDSVSITSAQMSNASKKSRRSVECSSKVQEYSGGSASNSHAELTQYRK